MPQDAAITESFWELLSPLRENQDGRSVATFARLLSELDVDSFGVFLKELELSLSILDTPAIANFPVTVVYGDAAFEDQVLSDDGFLYLRCYILTQGKQVFEEVVRNPTFLRKRAWREAECVLEVAGNAADELGLEFYPEGTGEHWLPTATGLHEGAPAGDGAGSAHLSINAAVQDLQGAVEPPWQQISGLLQRFEESVPHNGWVITEAAMLTQYCYELNASRTYQEIYVLFQLGTQDEAPRSELIPDPGVERGVPGVLFRMQRSRVLELDEDSFKRMAASKITEAILMVADVSTDAQRELRRVSLELRS